MTDVEFERYVENSIKPLFPNLEDTPRRRVLLKMDRGLGQNCLLAKCKFSGVYTYPGLPNATAVQQKTDQDYCPFEFVVQENLINIKRLATQKGKQRCWVCLCLGSLCAEEFAQF